MLTLTLLYPVTKSILFLQMFRDPRDNVEFADALYNNNVFLSALYDSLHDDGMIVMQLGEAPSYVYPADELSVDKNRATIISLMEYNDFESFHVYEEVRTIDW